MFIKLSDHAKLHYLCIGSGETLILVAGAFCNLHLWSNMVSELSQHFQVIYYDNRGIGHSDITSENYTIDLLSRDLLDLANALKLKKFHLAGHSMGGFVAQYFAAQYAERLHSLSLCSSLLQITSLGMHYLEKMEQDLKNHPDAVMAELKFIDKEKQAPEVLLKQILLCKEHDSSHYISKILTPAQIIYGSAEEVVTAEEAKRLGDSIKTTQNIVELESNHFPQSACPGAFATVLRDFAKMHQTDNVSKLLK
ncbi:MAG: alpha/beta hydrolase [Gammaproteobacteria bacterium]|nr:alpha/beta hydrolase [Gammaproteobacteria bacterium]